MSFSLGSPCLDHEQLRHSGDGDLRKAYMLAKKESSDDSAHEAEQPFPDSWLATTAPIALGLLTDVVSEFVVYREQDGRALIWPLIAAQYKMWCVGSSSWSPCEALVRISCRELHRLPTRIFQDDEFNELATSEQTEWATLLMRLYSEILSESVDLQIRAKKMLLDTKDDSSLKSSGLDDDVLDVIKTPFGKGRLLKRRIDEYIDAGTKIESAIATSIIELDFGATLYLPVIDDPWRGVPTEVDGECDFTIRGLLSHRCDFNRLKFFQFQKHIGSAWFRFLRFGVFLRIAFNGPWIRFLTR
jgi:hypothetical protein